MLVHVGELRLMALDFANDPGVVGGAAIDAGEEIVVGLLTKRGEVEVADVVQDAPAVAVSGTQVTFWADFADVEPGRYIARAVVTLDNDEVAVAEAAVVVE